MKVWGCLVPLLVLAALAISSPLWLEAWAAWLVAGEEPVPSGAVLVLGGGRGERLAAALGLYEAGMASRILIIGPGESYVPRSFDPDAPTQSEIKRAIAIRRGVPEDDVTAIVGATSTYEEALVSLDVLRRLGIRRVLIATSPFHTRRARQTFRHVFKGTEIQVRVIASPWEISPLQPERWWQREEDTFTILSETAKLIYYMFRHGVSPI